MLRKQSKQTISLSTTYGEEQGFVLVSSLILIGLLTVIGMTGLTMTDLEVQIGANQHSAKQAFYLADSGIQRAIKKLADDNSWPSTLSDGSDAFGGDNLLGAGSYVVEVFDDDPNPGDVRIRSTGVTTGLNGASATLEIIGTKGGSFPAVLDYAAFSCGNLELEGGMNEIRDGDVYTSGNLDMTGSGTHLIENANAYALGNINLDNGQILNGDAFTNENANLNFSGSPNVGGNVTAGGGVSGSGTVTGTVTSGASPGPVTDLCTGSELADLAITAETIQDYRDNADTTISDFNQSGGVITYTGIVHITDNMSLSGNLELTGNVIFIIDGNAEVTGPGVIQSNPPGSTVTFLVPYNNFLVNGGGNFVIDGAVQVGTVNEDGSNIQGGNIKIEDDSNLHVRGSAVVLNGNMKSQDNSTVMINYVAPTDSNLGDGSNSGNFTALQWREVRN